MRQTISLTSVTACLMVVGLLAGCGEKQPEQAKEAAPATAETTVAAGAAADPAAKPMDVHPGKVLHDANCISCHDSGVYTRADRKIKDFTQLAAQVRRCDANLGTRLFDEELEQVAEYLNQAYYQYPK